MIVAKITPHYKKERKTKVISCISGQFRLLEYIEPASAQRHFNWACGWIRTCNHHLKVSIRHFLLNKNAGIIYICIGYGVWTWPTIINVTKNTFWMAEFKIAAFSCLDPNTSNQLIERWQTVTVPAWSSRAWRGCSHRWCCWPAWPRSCTSCQPISHPLANQSTKLHFTSEEHRLCIQSLKQLFIFF
jgi:hypothetical protein